MKIRKAVKIVEKIAVNYELSNTQILKDVTLYEVTIN